MTNESQSVVRPRAAEDTGLRLTVVTSREHEAVVDDWGASFLQVPAWAKVKRAWRSESVGWFDASGTLVGVGLVLYRYLPRLNRCLAYLPEGPVLPWRDVAADPARWLDPLVEHVRRKGAFTLRIGAPVPIRDWSAVTAKAALADPGVARFDDVPPDTAYAVGAQLADQFRRTGWTRVGGGDGFGAGQPGLRVQVSFDGRSQSEILSGMSQQWRRNITRAQRSGVRVRRGMAADLPAFQALYTETAMRDGFTPRPLTYFQGMWTAFDAERSSSRLRMYIAELDAEPLSAATVLTVGRKACYSYGASTAQRRDVRASNAVQWRAMCDAHDDGCDTYDLRGVGSTLSDSDPLAGLLRFKLGIGGTAVEYVGEWEFALSPILHRAFQAYLRRRS